MKKLIALISSAAILLSQLTVFASEGRDVVSDFEPEARAAAAAAPTEIPDEEDTKFIGSIQYQAYEQIAGYIADRYLDDSYTAEDIMNIGLSEYLRENGDAAMVELLKAATHSLDDYSDFFTREEFIEYNDSLNHTFYGLGITMQQNGEYVEIAGFVEENGLAQQSGFMVGDKFVSVNGINVVGSSTTEVRNLVIGELGTTVSITVLRDGETVDLIGTRTAVNNSTVSMQILNGNIGYVRIASFATGTADEFKNIKKTLQAEGVTKLILDLRNNPGGLVSSAVSIAQELIPKGKIIDISYRDESQNYTFRSELDRAPFKLAVLINGNTASSSEILASSIQDSRAGILIGEQSFGKGVIQSTYQLRNGMVFKLTVGQYITRNGNEINHIGLTPNKEVENYKKKIDTSSYTKFDFLHPVSVGQSGVNVTAAKERLYTLGYFIGNLSNNVFNTDLADAVRTFQKNHGLTDSGVLDIPTIIELKTVFESLETTVDLQIQEAYKYFGGDPEQLYE